MEISVKSVSQKFEKSLVLATNTPTLYVFDLFSKIKRNERKKNPTATIHTHIHTHTLIHTDTKKSYHHFADEKFCVYLKVCQ